MSVLKNRLKEKFVTVPKKIITDNQISFGAKIVYCYLVSKPNDWVIRNSEIMEDLNISKDTIAKYFKELVVNGWIDRKRQVDSQNKFTGLYDYVIYETPKVSEIGKIPKSESFRNRENAGEITETISSSNNINNIIKKDNNINNINNTQSNSIKSEPNDKLVYESYKKILETKETDNIQTIGIEKDKNGNYIARAIILEKKAETPKDDINIPKTEKDAKNEPKQKPNEGIDKDTKPKKKFVKPTIEQIKEYAKEANLVNLDPNAFFDHFESNGWKVSGISPMKDWKAAMRTWNRRSLQFNKQDKKTNPFYERLKKMEQEEQA